MINKGKKRRKIVRKLKNELGDMAEDVDDEFIYQEFRFPKAPASIFENAHSKKGNKRRKNVRKLKSEQADMAEDNDDEFIHQEFCFPKAPARIVERAHDKKKGETEKEECKENKE